MKARPKGRRYRNLTARGGAIYYERVVGGRRIRFSTETADWGLAAAVRDAFEERRGIHRHSAQLVATPTFANFAKRYVAEDTEHLAPSTRSDRTSYLRDNGPLGFFRDLTLDAIDAPLLRKWWGAEIQGRGLSTKTGRSYVDVLAAVFGYALDLGLIQDTPVPAFRAMLRRHTRTKQGRAETQPGRSVHPIEEPGDLHRLVAAARDEGPVAHVFVLLLLDAGMRVGEALGLTWGSIAWGGDRDDRSRALVVERSRSRGGPVGLPKSGRARRVALSMRLRLVLADLYRDRFEPGPDAYVMEGVDPSGFRKREWRKTLKRAGFEHRPLKDLRDTYASHLLTAGVQLGYVSQQLGHADVAVTARHYARWAGGDIYRAPMILGPDEVPADFLARLESPQSPPTSEGADARGPGSPQDHWEKWHAGRDSNPRPSGSKPGGRFRNRLLRATRPP